jgi:hypothetical protein
LSLGVGCATGEHDKPVVTAVPRWISARRTLLRLVAASSGVSRHWRAPGWLLPSWLLPGWLLSAIIASTALAIALAPSGLAGLAVAVRDCAGRRHVWVIVDYANLSLDQAFDAAEERELLDVAK